MEDLVLVKIDSNYCDYLRKFDYRVSYNSNNKIRRPFVGVLFKVDDFMYFAPLSSPKPKFLKIKPKIDILKIDDGRLGAVNFNNMVPVMENNIIKIDLDNKKLNQAELQYNNLLKKQLFWLNRHINLLKKRGENLYNNYINGKLNERVMDRCCNFKLLEEKCKKYNNVL